VSGMAVGVVEVDQSPFFGDDDNGGNLRRVLFADETERPFPRNESFTTGIPEVTMASTEDICTTNINHNLNNSWLQQDGSNQLSEGVLDDSAANFALQIPPPKKRRLRFSYARKLFYASRDMYLQINPEFPSPESFPDLVGQIATCPTKKNNNIYVIVWTKCRTGAVIPLYLSHHLRTLFPQCELQPVLQDLIIQCELNNDITNSTASRQPTLLPPCQLLPPPPVPALGSHVPPPLQPPIPETIETTPVRNNRGFADLYTAGSVSGVSSLGHSEIREQQTRQRITRSSADSDCDSDGELTVDEDKHDVDFQENFWAPVATLDNEDNDDEEGPDPDALSSAPDGEENDYAKLLERCTHFEFREMSTTEANNMRQPQKVWDGTSGLKRNVASQFRTPLGAFQKAGFSEDMVAHWVINSNK